MPRVLYLGDTHLQNAAAYLAGLMHHWGWPVDYYPSDAQPAVAELNAEASLLILSDFPAVNLSEDVQHHLLEQVESGMGLVMCGGWESFHGVGGDWDAAPLAEALPVESQSTDDRRNCDQPVLVRRVTEHPATDGLPWETRPPVIGGLNQVRPKPEATLLLEAWVYQAQFPQGDDLTWQLAERLPLLVVGQWGQGRTAALMTDVAPHWVGPLIDWGLPRVSAQAPGGNAVEVGGDYARFLRQLLEWTAGPNK